MINLKHNDWAIYANGEELYIIKVSNAEGGKVIAKNIADFYEKYKLKTPPRNEFELEHCTPFFPFEQLAIDPILEYIRDNQEILTKKENLPVLAKLGYLYNTLFYAGRVAYYYTYNSLMDKYDGNDVTNLFYQCQDNPKYKIEMCEPKNEDIENYIYDAWGIHVTNNQNYPEVEELKELVFNNENKEALDKFVTLEAKANKTLDEWVEYMTHDNYKYKSLFTDRKSVLDYLLCTIGTGYKMSKDGYIVHKAGGAGVDSNLYHNWENAELLLGASIIVNEILSMDGTKETLILAQEQVDKDKRKQMLDDMETFGEWIVKHVGIPKEELLALTPTKYYKYKDQVFEILKEERLKRTKKEEEEKPKLTRYYPISTYSVMLTMLSDETRNRLGIKLEDIHQSYIDGGIEICEDIIECAKDEDYAKKEAQNVKFAKKFLTKFGVKDFSSELPKEIDKYRLEKEIKAIMTPILKGVNHRYFFNNTKKSEFGNNHYTYDVTLSEDSEDLLESLEDAVTKIEALQDVHNDGVLTYIENNKYMIDISPKSQKWQKDWDEYLLSLDLSVGKNIISCNCGDFIIKSMKPQNLGKTHPNNKSGKDIFSNQLGIDITDKNGKNIGSFTLDERFDEAKLHSFKGYANEIKDDIIEAAKKNKYRHHIMNNLRKQCA